MEQSIERKLLYYDHFQRMPGHYNGAPIFHFMCKDVKTGEDVTLVTCYFAEEMSKVFDGYYYGDIVEAANDFDILWNLSDERIRPVADTFDEVQAEYQRMINDGVTPEEINFAMITSFQQKIRSKTH